MRIAYLDCFSGLSGDMFLGALLDAGLDEAALRAELAKLPLHGWRLETRKVLKNAVSATDVAVMDEHAERHHHHHHHHHGDDHEPAHHRGLTDILQLIAASGLGDEVKATASSIFRRLGEAEAKIHGTTADEIRFHEVGAVDSIIDIVGAAIGINLLGLEELHASKLPLSHGFIECAHGTFPLPGPATTELLRGAPWYDTDIQGELITPTGAAILATLCQSFGNAPDFIAERVGYGSGKQDFAHPNVVRLMLGTKAEPDRDLTVETLTLIVTNIDDMNPEFYDHLIEQALALGALDVWLTPITMKKNRPAAQLSVLCPPAAQQALADLVLAETTTLGVRVSEVQRRCLDREMRVVATRHGQVRVKLSKRAGRVLRAAPEYEDCRRAAQESGAPLPEVYAAAFAAAQQFVDGFTAKESAVP